MQLEAKALRISCLVRVKAISVVLFLSLTTHSWTQTSEGEIKHQLDTIVNRKGFRNYKDTATLNAVAHYIENEFKMHTGNVRRQSYVANGMTYHNIITNIGDASKPLLVIGAHYDVCGQQKGADDNGTGVVGLLQLVKQLKAYEGDYYLEFVAYTLEEPPYYNTPAMGSYKHAESLHRNSVDVYGMICLEMLGYFSDAKKSQDYPIGLLKMIYGGKGNYITLVRKLNKGKMVRRFSRRFKSSREVRTKRFTAPKFLTGVDFSDHRSYWSFGYSALMITDTAFYRNHHYHENTDVVETIDFKRMAKVIDAVVISIQKL